MKIDETLAARLVAAQFPQWADLPVRPVTPAGWDNRSFRLGDDMVVRLPSAAAYSQQVEKEQRWLPRLAPQLPLPVPVPLAMGAPDKSYPWPWSVYRWLPGAPTVVAPIADLPRFAAALAEFLAALQSIDSADGPAPGPHCFHRGGPLTIYDGETRRAIAGLEGVIDTAAATALWESALAATWREAPIWFHGDIATGNLLVRDGALAAVIDFGLCGVGDPACDLAIAWTRFDGESREAFRARLGIDDACWARGRGWALWKALIVVAALPGANPGEIETSRRVLGEIFADHARVA